MINQLAGKSKILILFFINFIIGIFVSDLFKIDVWWFLGVSIGLILALLIIRRKLFLNIIIWSMLGILLGIIYLNIWDNHQKSVEIVNIKNNTFEGQVNSHPDFSGSTGQYILKLDKKKILLTTNRYPEFQYGDVLKIKGEIKKPSKYLYYKNISGQIKSEIAPEKIKNQGNIAVKLIYLVRDKFESSLNKSLTEPYASFAAGLILGSKRNIPDSLISDLNRTGTTHIIAVSGYNVTIIIIYIGMILGLISRKVKFWGSILAIIGFVIMTGGSASVLRAGTLAGLIIFAHFIGRRTNMAILILFVAFIMLLANPYALKYDISFQLSFLSFLGIIYLSPILLKITKIFPSFLSKILSETLAAQILVLPILVYYFGQLSLSSPIVNILILPLVPLAMASVFLVGLGGLVSVVFGKYLGYLGYLLLRYIIMMIENFSKIPFSAWHIQTNSWWWLPVCYLAILVIIIKFKPKNVQEDIFSSNN